MTAVLWAAATAHVLSVPLHVVGAYEWGLLDPWTAPDDPLIFAQMHHGCDKRVKDALASIRSEFPDQDVDGEVIKADPRVVLAERGQHASMIVVGTRHLTTLDRATLGPVSVNLTATAPCPVVVVCGPSGAVEHGAAVVVGVTGEPEDDVVLAFAFAFAHQHELTLRALMCWLPLIDGRPWGTEPPLERAERWLAEALAGWCERYPDLVVHPEVVREHPVPGLVAASAAQHLLVVGRRGRRSRLGSLLGSVSQGVLHHAACPVAVVPTGS